MSVLKVKNGNQWDIVPAIKGDPGDPAADESITDDMLVTDGIKTEIEWLWGNQLMDSREGELLHAEDAYTAPAVDISVDGKSTQVTTTGKNLVPPTADYYTIRKINGTNRRTFAIPVEPGEAFCWHRTSTAVDLNGCWCDEISDEMTTDNMFGAFRGTGYGTLAFTNTENHAYLVLHCSTTYKMEPIVTAKAQVERGSSFTEYETYTGGAASPRPDWPQDIASINDLELYQLNNKENFYAAFEWLDGYYATNGDIAASSSGMYEADYIPVSPGDILTYLYKPQTQTAAWMRFQIYDSEKTRIGSTTAEISAINVEPEKLHIIKRLISKSNAAYIRISINAYQNNAKTFMHVLTLQSTAPSLLPDGYSLRSLPDGTKDELHLSYLRPSKREGWAWYSRELVKRVGKFIATSPNGWFKSNFASNGYYKRVGQITDGLGKPNAKNSIMSPWFKAPDSLSEYFQTVNSCWVDSAVNFNIDPDVFSGTALEFGAWVAKHNIEYYMPLATPTTETLDPIELPIMPSQTVNVWSDPATNLKMTYIQDSNLIIENLEATIADIATS